jgi:plasmid stabilization system protein ParE
MRMPCHLTIIWLHVARKVNAMPRAAWSPKRERQYKHIKEAYQESGVSADEAEERAARTVNKERAEEGETKTTKKRRSSKS